MVSDRQSILKPSQDFNPLEGSHAKFFLNLGQQFGKNLALGHKRYRVF